MMGILDGDVSFQMGRDNHVFHNSELTKNLVNLEFVKNMVVPLPLKRIIPQRKPIFGMI